MLANFLGKGEGTTATKGTPASAESTEGGAGVSSLRTPVNSDVAGGNGPSRNQIIREQCLELLKAGKIDEFNNLRPAGELDLSHCQLSFKDLTGADLRNVNFAYANLRGVILTNAKLQRAILDRADLSGSTLTDAKLLQASLKHCNLSEVRSAKGAQFHEAQLHGAELNKGNFREAYFTKAALIGTSMVEGKFQGADFQEARLAGAMLAYADFSYANLSKARLFQTNGRDVNFTGANLTDAEAMRSFFTNTNLDPKAGTILKTSFDAAWVKGFKHDEFITQEMLLGTLSESYPPEGSFKQPIDPSDEKILVHDIPGSDKIRFDKAMQQLDELIGLVEVKHWAKSLVNFLIVKLARSRENLPDLEQTLHQLYMGSPGTGKTTVARIVSELLGSLGCLKKGHLVETDKAGMIAGYVGQTMAKTDELINSALDGTLFVDEIYALFQNDNDPYAKDGVAKLLKRMEDDRNRFCFVGAGYTKETMKTLESNSGLRSRISHIVTFPDYSTGELIDILKLNMKKKEFVFTKDLLAAASMVFVACQEIEGDKFGNGRTVRNLFEKMYKGPMADRLIAEDKLKDRAALRTPLVQDIPFEQLTEIPRGEFPPLEELRWIHPKTKEPIGLDKLPLDGPFPCMTEDSKKVIRAVVQTYREQQKHKKAA